MKSLLLIISQLLLIATAHAAGGDTHIVCKDRQNQNIQADITYGKDGEGLFKVTFADLHDRVFSARVEVKLDPSVPLETYYQNHYSVYITDLDMQPSDLAFEVAADYYISDMDNSVTSFGWLGVPHYPMNSGFSFKCQFVP